MGVSGTRRVSRESWLESQEGLRDTIKGWCLHSGTMVTQEGQGVTGGGEWKSTPNHWLSTKDWVWGFGVPSWLAKVRG